MACRCEGVYLCEIFNKVLHPFIQVFSSKHGYFSRNQSGGNSLQVRGQEVRIETNDIDWVCGEREGGQGKIQEG